MWAAFAAGIANLAAFNLPRALNSNHDWTKNYGITEWLINYQAGFSRRGIIGELLHGLWRWKQADPLILIASTSLALYLVFIIYLATSSKGKIASWLLLSGIFIGHPLYTDNVIRKDILLILLVVAMVRACPRITDQALRAFTTNLFMCAGMLIHEIFFFIALPCALSLVDDKHSSIHKATREQRSKYQLFSLKSPLSSVLSLAPTLILFTLLVLGISHSGENNALAIHQSWSGIWSNPSQPFPTEAGGSIMWLSANTKSTLELVLSIHGRPFMAIPSFAWLILIATLSSAMACAGMRNDLQLRFSEILIIQALSISPLFIIAVDSGRWLFFIFTTSLVLALEKHHSPPRLCTHFQAFKITSRRLLSLSKKLSKPGKWTIPSLLLFWGITGPEWSPLGMVFSSPLYQIWILLRNLNLAPSASWLIHGQL